jgi:hypothetical protein
MKKRSGIRDQESEIRNQRSGIRDQESEIRNQRSGIRDQGLGIGDQKAEEDLLKKIGHINFVPEMQYLDTKINF